MLPVYLSLNEYLTQRFGEKLYKLSLDTGFTCPNRDGTAGTGGCIFCSEGGSGEFAEKTPDINESIEKAKNQVSGKFRGSRYIAYFQSYSATYAPLEKLEEMFFTAAARDDIAAVSIATRPDCLGDEVLGLLNRLNSVKPVFVELGLQTVHEETAKLINRCYPLSDYDRAVKKLKEIGINTVVHIILGLPGESREMMLDTVRYVVRSGADGIKLHLMYVLKNTVLEKMYLAGEFSTLTLEEYADILCECIKIIPNNTVIHRLTGDPPKKLLVAPEWSADKKKVLNYINRRISEI